MKGWDYKPLGNCFPYIRNGANIKQINDAEGYPITRIETLSGGVFNRDRMGYANIFDLSKYNEFVIETGDLLMSHINSKNYIGRTVEYKKEGNETIIHGMNLLRLKSNENTIISAFFRYYTLSKRFKADIARIRKDAVNQSSFAISDLKKLEIPTPSIAIQRLIISELDKISSLVCLKKLQYFDLDALTYSIFFEMFGDPLGNEKGWTQKKIGDVCVEKKDIKRASKCFKDSDEIQYIDIRGVKRNEIERRKHERTGYALNINRLQRIKRENGEENEMD